MNRAGKSYVVRRAKVDSYVQRYGMNTGKMLTPLVIEAVLLHDKRAANIIVRDWDDDEELSGGHRVRELFQHIEKYYEYVDQPQDSDQYWTPERLEQWYNSCYNMVEHGRFAGQWNVP